MLMHEIVLETIWKWCANVSFKGVFQLPRLACSPDISQIVTGLPSTDQISRNNYMLRPGASVPNKIRRTSKHITHTVLLCISWFKVISNRMNYPHLKLHFDILSVGHADWHLENSHSSISGTQVLGNWLTLAGEGSRSFS